MYHDTHEPFIQSYNHVSIAYDCSGTICVHSEFWGGFDEAGKVSKTCLHN